MLPEPNTIQLYLWNYQQFNDREYATFQNTLSAAEQEKNQTYSQPVLRRRDAICRGLLRRHLGRLLQKPAHHIPIVNNDNGKPRLERDDDLLHFNYSHSGDYVVYAFCREAELGVDIEYTPRSNNLPGIANHFFAPAEVAALNALPETQQRERFFHYWTLKEAYIKARGEGIFIGLDKFSFEPGFSANSKAKRIKIHFASADFDTEKDWQFHCLQPLKDYQVSVAVRDKTQKKIALELPQSTEPRATHAI